MSLVDRIIYVQPLKNVYIRFIYRKKNMNLLHNTKQKYQFSFSFSAVNVHQDKKVCLLFCGELKLSFHNLPCVCPKSKKKRERVET